MKRVPLRQSLTLILLFALVSISLIVMDRRNLLDPVREGLTEIVNPVSQAFSRLPGKFGGDSDLQKQLDEATSERARLDAENSRLKGVDQENQVLREQLKVQEAHPDRAYLPAQVINSDPLGQQKFLIINRGSADGLRVGMAVVDPNYYVGQIKEVDEHTAKVMLIIDTSMKVGARLEDTQADGTVVGTWQGGQQPMIMENIDKSRTPKDGEKVVTSDMTRQIPAGIIIGVVWGEPIQNAQNDQLEVKVRPAANFDKLDMVFVVTSNDEN